MYPRGAQEPQHIRKPHSRSLLGPPFGRQFSVLFSIFRCFCGMLFLRAVLEGFRERFRVDFGTILEGNFEDLSYNFRCTLHIAKPHFDMVFIMFEAHQRFQESSQKLQNLRILRHISQRRARRGFWSHFGRILELFWEALGHQNRKKGDPKRTSKKVAKKSRGCAQCDPSHATNRGGVP